MYMKKNIANIFGKIMALLLIVVIITPSIFLQADDFIMRDDVSEIYTGRTEASALINAARFNDINPNSPLSEIIARGVALGLIHGDGPNFRPSDNLTRPEALAFAMRVIGRSGEAVALGIELAAELNITDAQEILALGYRELALDMEIITEAFPATGFATREEVAFLIFSTINAVSGLFDGNRPLTQVYGFNDWQSIHGAYLVGVENIVAANIMVGDGTNFNPRATITRGQMALVLSNLDSILFQLNNWRRIHGTVAGIQDAQYTTTGEAALWRNIHVRLGDGSVNVLQYQIVQNPSPQVMDLDALVFDNGQIGGLGMLRAGDTIEFIVDAPTNTLLYVNVLGEEQTMHVQGQLYAIDLEESTITIREPGRDGRRFLYSMAEGMVLNMRGNNYLIMHPMTRHNVETLPYGQTLRLTLRNNVVIRIEFIGQPVLVEEVRGLVVENNPAFGYMVIIDNNGQRLTMRYYENEMQVERVSHWDNPSVGYIAHLFPHFTFNPNVTTIDRVVPGDIVFIRPDTDDPGVISMISAASNYIMRYGRIAGITHHEGYMTLQFEFENGQSTWLDIVSGILITREGRRLSPMGIQAGDWARVLVNEAIIAPGHVVTSVVEMTIEGGNRHISNIVRGSLTSINGIQNQLNLEHAQTLSQAGWTNHANVARFNIGGNNIAFFHNAERITREAALRLFGRSDAMVYVALENHFAGEQVRKITFRTEREERLPANTVIHTDGSGNIQLAGQTGTISTDAGTIVRRHGRLVTGLDIFPSDYLSVVLNGAGRAAVIDIFERPDTSALQIMRARITSVADGESFVVASMSQLFGRDWIFTPVQREFTIDPRTVFLPQGELNIDTFLTYTDSSVYDQVFTVVTDGARASHIFTQPFANRAIRGILVSDVGPNDGNVMLRDVSIQNPDTGQWQIISNVNNTIDLQIDDTTLIGRNNAIVPRQNLRRGDEVLILTEFVPAVREPGMEVQARIILVD